MPWGERLLYAKDPLNNLFVLWTRQPYSKDRWPLFVAQLLSFAVAIGTSG